MRKIGAKDVAAMYKNKQFGAAREMAVQCADQQLDKECQRMAAELLMDGASGPEDPARALDYLLKSAKQEHPASQALLGNMYHNGNGVTKDTAEALKWWERSAENCNTWAQNAVARSYFDGAIVVKDEVRALYWVSVAAYFRFPNADTGVAHISTLLTPKQRGEAQSKTDSFIKNSGCGTSKPVVIYEPGAKA